MKAFITKYALTKGIFEIDGACISGLDDVIRFDKGVGLPYYFHGEGREWYRTFEGAVTRAEEMRLNRIAALKKQIAKLEKMTFDKAKPWT